MVLISISLMISDVKHLFISVGHLYVFFGKIFILCPFFNMVVSFCDVELYEFFVYFAY